MEGKRIKTALDEFRRLYNCADKREKSTLLNSFCEITGYHRKYAIMLLRKRDSLKIKKFSRQKKYSRESLTVIEKIWEASDYPWSLRLKSIIPLWLPWARKHIKFLTPEIESEILSISARQIDRRLKEKKRNLSKKIYGRTKPGTLLKHHIPLKTDSWDVHEPGFKVSTPTMARNS